MKLAKSHLGRKFSNSDKWNFLSVVWMRVRIGRRCAFGAKKVTSLILFKGEFFAEAHFCERNGEREMICEIECVLRNATACLSGNLKSIRIKGSEGHSLLDL